MSDSTFPQLAAVQEKVRRLLAHGASISEAAAATGLYRSTIYRWIQTGESFRMARNRGNAEYALTLRDDLRELSEMALRTLMAILVDPLASPAVRFKTASFILTRTDGPKRQWAMPVLMVDPQDNFELTEDNPLIAEDEQRLRNGAAPQSETTRCQSVFLEPLIPPFRPVRMAPAREVSLANAVEDAEPAENIPESA